MASPSNLPPSENRLLAQLPKAEYERLLPALEVMEMKVRDTIYEPNKPIQYVYFPLRGVGSMLAVLEDDTMVEVGTVGDEGMLGIPVFLGTYKTSIRAFWQVPGVAARMKAEILREEVKKGGPLVNVLQRYTQALFVMLAQLTACNRLHLIQQRAARWVLMTHDRVHDDTFSLTQEFLGQMLGTRRASVNEVMGLFQERGWLTYRRGILTILDRKALEAESCECYSVVKAEYDRMFEE